MRKAMLAVVAVAALVVPAAPAAAVTYTTDRIGRVGCGVGPATVTVAEPGKPTVTVDNVSVDVNHCLPPV